MPGKLNILKSLIIVSFWVFTGVAFLRPNPRIRMAFLVVFFGLMIPIGLSHRILWPFYCWDMWDRVEPPSVDYPEIWLIDTEGNEWRYDFSAVPPATSAGFEKNCGSTILERADLAPGLAKWLLVRARALQSNPREIHPQWWSPALSFLPVGPASRESCAGWSLRRDQRPTEFVGLRVRRQRIHFSTLDRSVQIETLEERTFPWTGS